MRKISFENFLQDLNTISIDDLDVILTDENEKVLVSFKVEQLYKGAKNFDGLKKLMNYHTLFWKKKNCTISVGKMSYTFFGGKFLHNLGDITIRELKKNAEKHGFDVVQILYIILNVDRIQF